MGQLYVYLLSTSVTGDKGGAEERTFDILGVRKKSNFHLHFDLNLYISQMQDNDFNKVVSIILYKIKNLLFVVLVINSITNN